MKLSNIAWHRLYNQGLLQARFEHPTEVVAWSGAVQAQDYVGAKWAVAQRTRTLVPDAEMDQAFNDGKILRTHVMRPTWHFVTPADIRWLLKLTAPRVHTANAYYYRTLGLDERTLGQSHEIIVTALEGNTHQTRDELAAQLHAAGINASGLRLTYIVMHAELEGIICSGPRQGNQFTYALLEERVPSAKRLERDEALAELTRRYFISHGPVLLKDFVWWSGLTVAEAKVGIELVKAELQQETINDQSYWTSTMPPPPRTSTPQGYLLPNYDEALASFKEYNASAAPQFQQVWASNDTLFPHYLVINGWVVGTWKRILSKRKVVVETKLFAPLTALDATALTTAAHRFGNFLGLPVELDESLTQFVG